MTVQIAVRLPDNQVEFLDQLVKNGQATSRAQAVSRALDREQRRLLAERDIALLLAAGRNQNSSLDALAQYAAGTALTDLDQP